MASDDKAGPDPRAAGISDLITGLAFLTRIPGMPPQWGSAPLPGQVAKAAWTFPVIGAGIGIAGGIALLIAIAIGLNSLVAGLLAILVVVTLTGAVNEAGLAATAEAGAGDTPPGRIARLAGPLGARGVLAIVFAVSLSAAALGGLAVPYETDGLFVLIAAEAVSFGAMVRPWRALAPATQDPATAGLSVPDERGTTTAIAIGALIAAILTAIAVGVWPMIVALAGAAAATFALEAWCRRRLGGYTRETLGAVQQVTAVTYLLLALAFA
ncbi:MAG: adenosylcobinamide-GDP ribazoletransferase [Bauldia sp.]|nr:adenosylcobinamide-GDP ribazoletransferase [Bauldia sp.]